MQDSKTGLLDLPNETILAISSQLTQVLDVWILAQQTRRLYWLLRDDLYLRDVQEGMGDSNALLRAVSGKNLTAEQRLDVFNSAIKAGANVNMLVFNLDGDGDGYSSQPAYPSILPRSYRGRIYRMMDKINKRGVVDSLAMAEATAAMNEAMRKLGNTGNSLQGLPQGHGGGLLTLAVMNGDLAMARLLLANGCNPNERDAGPGRRLYTAVHQQNLPMVELLLQQERLIPNITVHTQNALFLSTSWTAFAHACEVSSVSIVQLLHDDPRVHVDMCEMTGIIPAWLAFCQRRKSVVRLLTRSEKSKTARDDLFQLACGGNYGEFGLNVMVNVLKHATEKDRQHAAHWMDLAAENGFKGIAQMVADKWPCHSGTASRT